MAGFEIWFIGSTNMLIKMKPVKLLERATEMAVMFLNLA